MRKTLLSIVAFAAIIGLSYADEAWFNGNIGETASGGSWTSPLPTGVTLEAKKYALDDVDLFSFTADAAKSASAASHLNFSSSVQFQYAYDELPEVSAGEKAGVIAYENTSANPATTNYWVLATNTANSASTLNTWVDTGITATLAQDVNLTITVSNGVNSTWVYYQLGDSTFVTNVTASSSSFQYVDYSGCGKINSLIGKLIALGIVVPGYPTPIPQGPQLTAWLEANHMTEADLKDTTPQANGHTAYENCVLGIKNDAALIANAQDTSASRITFGIASTPMSGVTVQYELKTNTTVLATGTTPTFERDIHDGVYQIVAKIAKNEGSSEISSAKVGAMKINSTKETEFIAVPWTAFGGAAGIAPTALVKASGLTANDTLEVYDAANGDWEGYRWDGSKWNATTDNPNVTALTRGMAVKLRRANGSANTYLVGGAVDSAAATPVQNGKWNLVANPGFGAYTIGTSLGTSTKDKVMIATNGVGYAQYTYRGTDGWRKLVPEVKDGVQTTKRVAEDLTVPQGVGFFFVNQSGKGAINW